MHRAVASALLEVVIRTRLPRKTFLLHFQFCIIAFGCSCRHVHFRLQAKDIPKRENHTQHHDCTVLTLCAASAICMHEDFVTYLHPASRVI